MMRFIGRLGLLIVLALNAGPVPAQTNYFTGWFTISQIYLAEGGNMHLRVYGMPTMSYCTSHNDFAYVELSDAGSQGKEAALLAAFSQGKQVNLLVQPADFYSNGSSFCHILEFYVGG